MMYLDKHHPKPVYLQLKELLQTQIEQGAYLPHQKLPSERDLCQQYDLSRMTARRALKELIANGFAYTRVGKGTFVSPVPRAQEKAQLIETGQAENFSSTQKLIDHNFCQKIMASVLSFDPHQVKQVVSESLAVHPVETVTGKLLPDVIKYSEKQWADKEISLPLHNYTITTLYAQLIGMMNAAATTRTGPKIILACTPGDIHELGLISLALSLLRRKFLVIYIGANSAFDEFEQLIEITKPQVICLSAATDEAVKTLSRFSQRYAPQINTRFKANLDISKPLFAFGGVALNQNPALVSQVKGIYLGNSVERAVSKIQEMVPIARFSQKVHATSSV